MIEIIKTTKENIIYINNDYYKINSTNKYIYEELKNFLTKYWNEYKKTNKLKVNELKLNIKLDEDTERIIERFYKRIEKENSSEINIKKEQNKDIKLYTSYFGYKNKLDNSLEVSISLYPPKWFKSDLQLNELTPSKKLLLDYKEGQETKEGYIKRFKTELNERFKNSEDLIKLKKYLIIEMNKQNKKSITLNCFEKSEDFCHRHLLTDFFKIEGEVKFINNKQTTPTETTTKEPLTIENMDEGKKLLLDVSNYVIRYFSTFYRQYVIKIDNIIYDTLKKNDFLTEELKKELEEKIESIFLKNEKLLLHTIFNSLIKHCKKEKIDLKNIILCFDSKSYINMMKDVVDYLETANKNNKSYKGQRKIELNSEMTFEEQLKQLNKRIKKEYTVNFMKKFKNISEKAGLKTIKEENFEADHFIGLLTKYFNNKGIKTQSISRDEDFKQIITNDLVEHLIPTSDGYVNLNIENTNGQLDLLYKISIGDSSDNIPSIFWKILDKRGIKIQLGEKTIIKELNNIIKELNIEAKDVTKENYEIILNTFLDKYLKEKIEKYYLKTIKEKIKEDKKKIIIPTKLYEKYMLGEDIKELGEKKWKEEYDYVILKIKEVVSDFETIKMEVKESFKMNSRIIDFDFIPKKYIEIFEKIVKERQYIVFNELDFNNFLKDKEIIRQKTQSPMRK